MTFVEAFLNGLANALGYLVVFGVLTFVLWRLGSRLIERAMKAVYEMGPTLADLAKSRSGNPAGGRPCRECGFPNAPESTSCPNCQAIASMSPEEPGGTGG